MAKMTKTEEISYDVVEEYAVIAESEDGLRKKEINLVSWNQNEAKVDMRWWTYNEDGERVKCNKGVTLTLEELENIVSVALDNGLVDYTPSESDDEEDYDEEESEDDEDDDSEYDDEEEEYEEDEEDYDEEESEDDDEEEEYEEDYDEEDE